MRCPRSRASAVEFIIEGLKTIGLTSDESLDFVNFLDEALGEMGQSAADEDHRAVASSNRRFGRGGGWCEAEALGIQGQSRQHLQARPVWVQGSTYWSLRRSRREPVEERELEDERKLQDNQTAAENARRAVQDFLSGDYQNTLQSVLDDILAAFPGIAGGLEFPEGTPEEVIAAAIRKASGGQIQVDINAAIVAALDEGSVSVINPDPSAMLAALRENVIAALAADNPLDENGNPIVQAGDLRAIAALGTTRSPGSLRKNLTSLSRTGLTIRLPRGRSN